MTRTTVWITGDQCTPRNSALAGLDRERAPILMIESLARSREKPYHKRKLVLIYAAMRGFAADLRRDGWASITMRSGKTSRRRFANTSRAIGRRTPV